VLHTTKATRNRRRSCRICRNAGWTIPHCTPVMVKVWGWWRRSEGCGGDGGGGGGDGVPS
jgi:hypothetical protein